ncbi:MAG: citrulline utilization hydrolase CtlX [Crocinitomicaceae bacterium]
MKQSTSHIFMVYPSSFGFNTETAESNHFQTKEVFSLENRAQAQKEFDNAVEQLRAKGIDVTVLKDKTGVSKPDAVFPNNWISIHKEGYILYPMEAENRRIERDPAFIDTLSKKLNIGLIKDLSVYEKQNRYMEGTGSIIFDHIHKKAYAAISSRTDAKIVEETCELVNYKPVLFHSKDREGNIVYHTNVLLAIGTNYAVLCLDAIPSDEERTQISEELKNDGIEIIEISMDQMYSFAGNMLELTSSDGQKYLVMSMTAHNSLTTQQLKKVRQFAEPLVIDVSTIEKFGGGSIRCMMAELFF